MQAKPDPGDRCADVVLLVGPSGCGKTFLAREAGLPILALDDFYRPATDPAMPIGADGQIDWEDPASWDGDAAEAALERFCCEDGIDVPDYSFHENRAVGVKHLERKGSPVVLAEGIFAAELIERLRASGLLGDALLIRQNRWKTFVQRLIRDLREHRKSRWYLVRQGWAKTMAEPAVVRHQLALGATPMAKEQVRARLAELARRPKTDLVREAAPGAQAPGPPPTVSPAAAADAERAPTAR